MFLTGPLRAAASRSVVESERAVLLLRDFAVRTPGMGTAPLTLVATVDAPSSASRPSA